MTMTATPWEQSHFFTATDGTKIHFRDSGATDGDGGIPVLFIHGYTASIGGQWGRPGLIHGLREAGFRTIAFDLRGHGLSDKPHEAADYAHSRMGRDALELLAHLGIAKAHIVGYSLCAHIILHTLVKEGAAQAETLTLGGAAGRWNWTEEETAAVFDEADELEQGAITKHILRLWPAHKPRPAGEELAALSQKKLEGMDARALAAIKRVMPDHVVTRAEVQALALPILGFVGTDDPQLPAFREMKGFLPAMELVEINGAGHGDCPGKPEAREAVIAFLRAHDGAATGSV